MTLSYKRWTVVNTPTGLSLRGGSLAGPARCRLGMCVVFGVSNWWIPISPRCTSGGWWSWVQGRIRTTLHISNPCLSKFMAFFPLLSGKCFSCSSDRLDHGSWGRFAHFLMTMLSPWMKLLRRPPHCSCMLPVEDQPSRHIPLADNTFTELKQPFPTTTGLTSPIPSLPVSVEGDASLWSNSVTDFPTAPPWRP